MFETVSYSILVIIGILLALILAVFIFPYIFVLGISGALIYAAFTCGDLVMGIILFVSGLLFLSGGLRLAKDLTYGVMSRHESHLIKTKHIIAAEDEIDFPVSTNSPPNPLGH